VIFIYSQNRLLKLVFSILQYYFIANWNPSQEPKAVPNRTFLDDAANIQAARLSQPRGVEVCVAPWARSSVTAPPPPRRPTQNK